ncbi:MAG: alpha/beta fold hydrolase, partial [Pikeienuella sp.]
APMRRCGRCSWVYCCSANIHWKSRAFAFENRDRGERERGTTKAGADMWLIKRLLAFVSAVVVVLAVLGYLASRIWPDRSAEAMLMAYSASAGLERKSVNTAFGPVGYFEGGEGAQTVVLLHGIFARKEHWIDLSRQITDGYRVIIPDLPGFGDNPALLEGQYAYASQVRNIRAVLDAIGLDRFHVAGNSMGGQISGLLAEVMPRRILSVAFIGSPVGIDIPAKSRFDVMMTRENGTLVVSNMAEFDARNALLFPEKPFVPRLIESYWAELEIAQATTHQQIWAEVTGSNIRPLQSIAPDIAQPALVVWCREDEIFDFSGAQVLVDALPNGRLAALSGCGHVPSLDAPKAAGRALRVFLDGL